MYLCGGFYCFTSWCLKFCAICALCMFSYLSLVLVTEWLPIWIIAAYSAYDMFSWYKCLIVNLVFPTSVFGVGISF